MGSTENSPIKKIASLFSKTGFGSFLDDSAEKLALEQAQADIIQQLQIAAAKRGIVVLKLQSDERIQKYETVSGWIATKTLSGDNLMLKLSSDEHKIRMIPIDQIKKISMMAPNGERKKISK